MLLPRIRYGLELYQLDLLVSLSTPLIEIAILWSTNGTLEMPLVRNVIAGNSKINWDFSCHLTCHWSGYHLF